MNISPHYPTIKARAIELLEDNTTAAIFAALVTAWDELYSREHAKFHAHQDAAHALGKIPRYYGAPPRLTKGNFDKLRSEIAREMRWH